jgi:hypothetical protein
MFIDIIYLNLCIHHIQFIIEKIYITKYITHHNLLNFNLEVKMLNHIHFFYMPILFILICYFFFLILNSILLNFLSMIMKDNL